MKKFDILVFNPVNFSDPKLTHSAHQHSSMTDTRLIHHADQNRSMTDTRLIHDQHR